MNFRKACILIGVILIALSIISYFYDLPSYITSILTFCWMLFVPYTMGLISLEILFKRFPKLIGFINSLHMAGNVITWFFGVFIISVILYLISVSQLHFVSIIGLILLSTSVVFYLLYKPINVTPTLPKKKFISTVLLVIMGIVFGYYVRSYSPYPLSPGIDVFNHMYVIHSILDNSFSKSMLVYFPNFDILIALGSSTFNANLDSIFWMGSIFLTVIFTVSTYFLINRFLVNNLQAALGTIIALFLTEMGFATNLQFFYPASFLMGIFPMLLLVIDSLWTKRSRRNLLLPIAFTALVFTVLFLIHTYIGFIVSFILSIYIVCVSFISMHPKLFLILRIISIILSLVVVAYFLGYLTFQLKVDFIESNMFESYHLYNTITKVKILEDWYTKEIISLAIVGMVILSFHRSKKITVLNFLGILMLLTYFQQISDIHRIMPLARIPISIAATIAISLPFLIIINYIYNKSLKARFKDLFEKSRANLFNENSSSANYKKSKLDWGKIQISWSRYGLGVIPIYERKFNLFILYVLVVFTMIFPILLEPYSTYINTYLNQGYNFTNYTYDELETGNWIKENIPENYEIYSDPSTVIELRGLSYRMNIEGIGWNTSTANEVKSVLLSENPAYAYDSIVSNQGHDVVIVITPRTTEWLRSDLYFVQMPIKDFVFFAGIEKFFDDNYFELAYNNDSVMVFTLR
jgi:hypothetical protein